MLKHALQLALLFALTLAPEVNASSSKYDPSKAEFEWLMNPKNVTNSKFKSRLEEFLSASEKKEVILKPDVNRVEELAHQFQAREVDSSDRSFVFELADIPAKLNEFISCLKPYGLIELARTGITAISRGAEGF